MASARGSRVTREDSVRAGTVPGYGHLDGAVAVG